MSADGSQRGLASLRGRSGVTEELLVIEERLLAFRHELLSVIETKVPTLADGERTRSALTSGTPLVTLCDPDPGQSLLEQSRQRLLGALAESVDALASLPQWFAALSDHERAARTADWFAAAWRDDRAAMQRLSAQARVDAEVLHWSGRHLARPFFQHLATPLRGHELLREQWSGTAGCPHCGGTPRFGRYAHAEGQRFLWCDLCDLEWYFPRITCAFCLNQNHQTLGYLKIEEDQEYRNNRIDVCEECHGYLRSVDERERPEGVQVDYLIEDVGSLELCLAAEREGYRSGKVSDRAGEATGIAQTPGDDRTTDPPSRV